MSTATMNTPVPAAPVKDPMSLARDAVRKLTTIATLPEVTAQIIKTVENSRSTAAQLHKIVSHDPALVTRILKVVNSAFYGLPGQVGSIERAIVLLGLNAVKNIAVAASLGQLFRGVKLCDGYTAKDLWAHCIAVAVASREIARQMKLSIADEAFLAGMIHDIGLLVALQSSPEKLRTVCTSAQAGEGKVDFCAIEREQMDGVDHAMLGMALAEHWKFPRSCQVVAGYHHQPDALGDEGRQLITLIHIADCIAASEKQGFPLTASSTRMDAARVAELGFDPVVVERVRVSMKDLVEKASQLLG